MSIAYVFLQVCTACSLLGVARRKTLRTVHRPQFIGISIGSSLMGVVLGLACSLVRRACVLTVVLVRLNRMNESFSEDDCGFAQLFKKLDMSELPAYEVTVSPLLLCTLSTCASLYRHTTRVNLRHAKPQKAHLFAPSTQVLILLLMAFFTYAAIEVPCSGRDGVLSRNLLGVSPVSRPQVPSPSSPPRSQAMHMSGVMGLFFCGVVLSHYNW